MQKGLLTINTNNDMPIFVRYKENVINIKKISYISIFSSDNSNSVNIRFYGDLRCNIFFDSKDEMESFLKKLSPDTINV